MDNCPQLTELEQQPRTSLVESHLRACTSCRSVAELIRERADGCEQIELLLAADTRSAEDVVRLQRHLALCEPCRRLVALDEQAAPEPTHDRYAMGDELARGGMGRVLDAHDLQLERRVAVKVLLRDAGADAGARFRREAMITARLQHPAIVPIYEMGSLETGERFYAMRKVSGETLEDRLRQARSLTARLAFLPNLLATAEAIAYAHCEGVVHRDLKPSNVMLGPFGETVVVDWGLAKVVGEPEGEVAAGPYRASGEAGLTAAGAVLGTPQYMSPEQARGEPVDARTDVYALGSMLYSLLAGQPPYGGRSSREILAQVKLGEPTPIHEAAPEAPSDLRAIVAKAIALDPVDRYRAADELAEDLRRFQTGQLVRAHAYSPTELVRRWVGRNRKAVAVGSLLVTALMALVIFSVVRIIRERDRAEAERSEAERQRQKATRTSLALLQEQGRQHVLDNQSSRAAVYLGAAYSAGADNPALRFLLARAAGAVEARSVRIPEIADAGLRADPQFSPDGRLLAGRTAQDVRVWDADTGRLVRMFPVPNNRVIRWSGDSARIALGQDAVSVWEVATGAPLCTIDTRSELYALDRAGERLYVTEDRRITVWEVATGERIAAGAVGTPGDHWIGVSPDDRYVISSGHDGVILYRDPRTLDVIGSLGGPGSSFHVDGDRAVTGMFDRAGHMIVVGPGPNKASIVQPGRAVPDVVLSGHEGAVIRPGLSLDGSLAVTSSVDGTARVWSAGDGALRHTFRGSGVPTLAAFAWDESDGHPLVLTTTMGQTSTALHETLGGVETARYEERAVANPGGGRFLLLADEGRLVRPTDDALVSASRVKDFHQPVRRPEGRYIVDHNFDTGSVWDASSGRLLESLKLHGEGWLGSLAPDGSRVMEHDDTGSIIVRRVTSAGAAPGRDERIAILKVAPTDIANAAFSPEGEFVVIHHLSGGVSVWNASSGVKVADLAIEEKVASRAPAAVGPGAERVITLSADGSAVLWDRTGERVARIRPTGSEILVARFFAHGDTFVLYSRTGPARDPTGPIEAAATLWSARDGNRLADLGRAVVFPYVLWGETDLRDERFLFAGAVWETRTGKKLMPPPMGPPGPGSGSFSDDGRLVAYAGGIGGPAGAWIMEVPSGRIVASLGYSAGQSAHARLTPEGDRIALSGLDGSLTLWDVHSGALLARIPTSPPQWMVNHSSIGGEATVVLTVPVFGSRGDVLFTVGPDLATRTWDVHLESRSPEQIADLVRGQVPWRLEEGALAPNRAGADSVRGGTSGP